MPPPRPVVCDLVFYEETDFNPEYWGVMLYRDNFETFSGEDKLVIFNWVSDVVRTIRNVTGANCYAEVDERVPR